MNHKAKQAPGVLLSTVGALLGAPLGWLLAGWVMHRSILGCFLIGALMGIGARWLGGRGPMGFGIASGVAALFLGLLCHWRVAPFAAGDSFGYFLQHAGDLGLWSWMDVGFGALLAFRIPTRQAPGKAV